MYHKYALIIGGGGAIAEAVAIRLERAGYQLILVDRNESALARVSGLLQTMPERIVCDVSDAHDLSALCERIATDWPDIELLVNCVAFIEPGDIVDVAPADVARHISVNQLAPMVIMQTVARLMVMQGRGDILSVLPLSSMVAMRGSAAYSASQAGLRSFQSAIHGELAVHGVRVMGVFVGAVDTPLLRYAAAHPAGSPLHFVGHVHSPEAVASACLRALETGVSETYLAYRDSVWLRVMGMFPWLLERIGPWLEEQGERKRQRFLRRLR